MFFSISSNKENISTPFSHKHKLDNFVLSLDDGWHQHENIFYKGYCLEQRLDQKVLHNNFEEQSGNYLILDFSSNGCQLYYDNSRSFPMFFDKKTVTNFKDDTLTPVWFDGSVYYENNQWHFKHRKENSVTYPGSHTSLNKQQIVDLWCDYLVRCCEQLETDLPIFCAASNGVDSLSIQSAFDYCGKEYILVNQTTSTKASLGWGYNQLFETSIPHVQATGFCGDELLLRNPLYCQWLLDSRNIDLTNEFDKTNDSYMKPFFNKTYREKVKKNVNKISNFKEGYELVANTSFNDYQMWHTDHTLTFTPYRNIEMATKCLQADADTILDQVIHAGTSNAIIKRLNPHNTKLLSKYKNNY